MFTKGLVPETEVEEMKWVDTFTGPKDRGQKAYRRFFQRMDQRLRRWERFSVPTPTHRRGIKLVSLLLSLKMPVDLAKVLAGYVGDPASVATSNSLLVYLSYAWEKGGEIPEPSLSSPVFLMPVAAQNFF